MEPSEENGPQSHIAEGRKKRRHEEAEMGSMEHEGGPVKTRQPKRLRRANPTSSGAVAGAEALGKRRKGSEHDTGSYGSEEGEVEEGGEPSGGEEAVGHQAHASRPSKDEGAVSSPENANQGGDGGEVGADSPPSSSEPRPSGWNRGISSGQVRTSLFSLGQKAPVFAPVLPTSVPASAPAPVTTTTAQAREQSPLQNLPQPTSLPSSPSPVDPPSVAPSHYQNSDISLKLPPPGDRNPGESWQVRFQDWTNALLELNPGQTSSLSPETVLDAYSFFIDRVCTIHNKKKRSAKAGAELFSQKGSLSAALESARGTTTPAGLSTTQDTDAEMGGGKGRKGPSRPAQPLEASAGPAAPTAADWGQVLQSGPSTVPAAGDDKKTTKKDDKSARNGTSKGQGEAQPKENGSATVPPTPHDHPSIPSGDEELKLQQRYFPRLGAVSDACILCLQQGHQASLCPTLSCKYCGVTLSHTSYACPSKRRCGKCKTLGHTVKDCTQGHVTSHPDNTQPCAHCGGNDHIERDCDVLWRTYRPVDSTRKVHSIVAFCGTCGEEGHFFEDCALNSHRLPKSRTWTQENLALYMDNTSRRGPIADSRPGPSELRRPELTNKASENIYFESDESDGENQFIGARVGSKPSVGRISVSSNIRFGNQAGPAPGTQGSSYGQPSTGLPPRPQSLADPARSGNWQQDSRSQHQLPPRPPAARRGGSSNYQAVPPPPALQQQGQGKASRDGGNGNSKNSGRGGRGGGRGSGRGRGGRGGNSKSTRGSKW